MHSGLYDFLRDQGSLIAGILALIAGLVAYRVGKMQVRAIAAAETNANIAAAEAVIREVIEYNKLVIEALRICSAIHSGKIQMERRNAYSIMMNSDPVVYKAVATRIARLPFDAQLLIQFHLRIVYIQQTIQIIVFGPGGDDAAVPRGEIQTLSKNLIIICQLAQAIIRHAPSTGVTENVSQIILAQIDAALEKAKQSFPKLFLSQQGGCEQSQSEVETVTR
jgi:hypothetical protein